MSIRNTLYATLWWLFKLSFFRSSFLFRSNRVVWGPDRPYMTGYIDDWPLNHIRSIWLNLAVSLFFADQTVTFPNGQGQHKICPLADGWRTSRLTAANINAVSFYLGSNCNLSHSLEIHQTLDRCTCMGAMKISASSSCMYVLHISCGHAI